MNRPKNTAQTNGSFGSAARTSSLRVGNLMGTPLNPQLFASNSPEATLPAGYRLVDGGSHMISNRDMVFVGGTLSFWQPARRAGESGGLRMFSVVQAVAAPSFS